MADLLVDTDVLVDHLRGAKKFEPRDPDRVSYSVITRCELMAGPESHERAVQQLLEPLGELPVDRSVAERAGRIRRDTGVRTPDALIAATALDRDLTLITRNRKDFERVPRLKLSEPS